MGAIKRQNDHYWQLPEHIGVLTFSANVHRKLAHRRGMQNAEIISLLIFSLQYF